jgi:hypothetical protein
MRVARQRVTQPVAYMRAISPIACELSPGALFMTLTPKEAIVLATLGTHRARRDCRGGRRSTLTQFQNVIHASVQINAKLSHGSRQSSAPQRC